MSKPSTPDNLVLRYPVDASEARKLEIQKEALEDLKTDLTKEVPELKFELPKESWQEEVIDKVNIKITNFFQDELGLAIDEIPIKNIHFFKPDDMVQVMQRLKAQLPEQIKATSFREHLFFSSLINKDELAKLEFTDILIHEYLHNKAFFKISEIPLDLIYKKMDVVGPERQGLSILKRGKYPPEWYFEAFDEGLTELFKNKILHLVVKDDSFYKTELDKKFSKTDKKIKRQDLFNNWGVLAYNVEDVDIHKTKDRIDYDWRIKGVYLDEQKLILFLAAQIAKSKSDKYNNVDEVLNLFFRAQYRGELLPLAKEIDSTFGKGTFRLLAVIPNPRSIGAKNQIARNFITFLRMPPEKRDPELAKKYIFLDPAEFEKYISKLK